MTLNYCFAMTAPSSPDDHIRFNRSVREVDKLSPTYESLRLRAAPGYDTIAHTVTLQYAMKASRPAQRH